MEKLELIITNATPISTFVNTYTDEELEKDISFDEFENLFNGEIFSYPLDEIDYINELLKNPWDGDTGTYILCYFIEEDGDRYYRLVELNEDKKEK